MERERRNIKRYEQLHLIEQEDIAERHQVFDALKKLAIKGNSFAAEIMDRLDEEHTVTFSTEPLTPIY